MISKLSHNRVLCSLLSLSLAFSSFPFQPAFAEGESVNSMTGSGGSISIDFIDKDGQPISKEALKPGMKVFLRPNAHTPEGNSTSCTPTFRPIQGITGNQLGDEIKVENGIGSMEVGKNMGTAEIAVQCKELPGVEGKTQVANVGGLMTPAEKKAAANKTAEQNTAQTQAVAASSGGGNVALGILGGVVAVGATVALVGMMMPKKWCGSWHCSSTQCGSVMGGMSGSLEFSSESECRGHFSGTTFGSSCHEC